MTISCAEVKLFEFFTENKTFDIKKDFNKVITISETPEKDKAILIGALKNLEKMNIVQNVEHDNENFYVLVKPLDQYNQTVEIKANTALALANSINEFCDAADNQNDRAYPLNITNRDIQNLVILYQEMLQQKVNAHLEQKD